MLGHVTSPVQSAHSQNAQLQYNHLKGLLDNNRTQLITELNTPRFSQEALHSLLFTACRNNPTDPFILKMLQTKSYTSGVLAKIIGTALECGQAEFAFSILENKALTFSTTALRLILQEINPNAIKMVLSSKSYSPKALANVIVDLLDQQQEQFVTHLLNNDFFSISVKATTLDNIRQAAIENGLKLKHPGQVTSALNNLGIAIHSYELSTIVVDTEFEHTPKFNELPDQFKYSDSVQHEQSALNELLKRMQALAIEQENAQNEMVKQLQTMAMSEANRQAQTIVCEGMHALSDPIPLSTPIQHLSEVGQPDVLTEASLLERIYRSNQGLINMLIGLPIDRLGTVDIGLPADQVFAPGVFDHIKAENGQPLIFGTLKAAYEHKYSLIRVHIGQNPDPINIKLKDGNVTRIVATGGDVQSAVLDMTKHGLLEDSMCNYVID